MFKTTCTNSFCQKCDCFVKDDPMQSQRNFREKHPDLALPSNCPPSEVNGELVWSGCPRQNGKIH